jgi:hypothetical protein
LVVRSNADLFDVGRSVDDIDHHVPDREIRGVDGNPAPARRGVAGQRLERGRLVIRHGVQPDGPESLPRLSFDLAQHGPVVGASGTDLNGHGSRLAGTVATSVRSAPFEALTTALVTGI